MEEEVHCAECGRKLDETGQEITEERSPCPECGSRRRIVDGSVVIRPRSIPSGEQVPAPSVVEIGTAQEVDLALPIGVGGRVQPKTFERLRQALAERGPDWARTYSIKDLQDGHSFL